MARPDKWCWCLRTFVVALMLLILLGPAAASARRHRGAVTPTLKQCHSGTNGAGPCIYEVHGSQVPTGWDPGNINSSNSLYRAGDFAPFRLVITGLSPGTMHTLSIGYQAVESGLHAYDYLGTYHASKVPNGLLQQVVPCAGVGDTAGVDACGQSPSTLPIPKDTPGDPPGNPGTTFPTPLAGGTGTQADGDFSAWGATLLAGSAKYVQPSNCSDCGVPVVAQMAGTVSAERDIEFRFRADGPTVVLAWSAHIATPLDWGFGGTQADAGSGSGAFHMSLVQLDGSPGNQDESMNQNAIASAPGISTQVSATSVLVGQPVTDTATLTARSAAFPVTGAVHFFVCGPLASFTGCSQGGSEVNGSPQNVAGNPNATVPITFTPSAAGSWCFRVLYVPDAEAGYSPGIHTAAANECFVATLPGTQLIVTKLCDPESDPGLFNLFVDGLLFGAATNVPCGHVEGPHATTAGAHSVTETAGTGTNLANYTTTFGGDCNDLGVVTVAAETSAVCEITNSEKPLVEASLTLTKVCVPANDPGRFQFKADGNPVAELSCGQSTTVSQGLAPVRLAAGTHTVSEAGVPPTNLSDYTTVISGDCAADGSITLAAAQSASCTFTNTRIPPPTTLRVDKACVPAGDDGHFNLTIDGNVAGTGANVACGGTTGTVTVSPGSHKVGETAASGTDLGHYKVVIGGACATDGTATLAAGQTAVCLITNVRSPLKPPPPPDLVCYHLTVKPRTATAGKSVRIFAHVHIRGRGVHGVRVYLAGPGVAAVRTTGATGHAVFELTFHRHGIIRVTIRKPYLCPKPPPHHIGIEGVQTPPITG
jgi:hypothetical protein